MDSNQTTQPRPQNGPKESTIYYAVYTPNDTGSGPPNVFEDKESALKLAKKNKKSRFKAFEFYHEAVEFAVNGSECSQNASSVDGNLSIDKKETAAAVGEKASPFKGPKPQELTEFRKAIESGNLKVVQDAIWINPRLLVSSGDTPSILQEGARLNALHVSARSRNSAMTEFILNTITDPEFIKRLYGDDNQQNAEDRCKILLDLYLNTPNKGMNDTPLHIATKWGAVEVVEVLVSYPECNKFKKNKYDKMAHEVICERVESTRISKNVAKRIETLLCDNYYVPVLRTEDNTFPPMVGEPFSPASPPVLNKDPLSPRLEIHAYAGPIDKKGADRLRKLWKTPPRCFSSPNGIRGPIDSSIAALKFKDPQKGLERIGHRVAKDFNVCWKEYWKFLDSFVDISSEEGLNMLEKHLAAKNSSLNDSMSFSSAEKEDSSPQIVEDEIISPISSLCAAFSAFKLNDSILNESGDLKPLDFDALTHVEKACQVFTNRIMNNISLALCCNNTEFDVVLKNLENDVKQLELLMNSYMDDNRFYTGVEFQKVHPRLGVLIGQKLYNNVKDTDGFILVNKIEDIAASVMKMMDCFSSDDESHNQPSINKSTTYRKQLVCLIQHITSDLSERLKSEDIYKRPIDLKRTWDNLEECNCVYHPKKPKKTNSLSKSSSFKNREHAKAAIQAVSKKLFVENGKPAVNGVSDLSLNINDLNTDSSDSDSENDFYTPPSSPAELLTEDLESDDNEEFNDTVLPSQEVFLEGDHPTKTDCAVYNALRDADCEIDQKKYPNVYRWHHCVNLYSKSERESWTSSNPEKSFSYQTPPVSKTFNNKSLISSPCPIQTASSTSTPTKPSWLRVTGVNSPRSSFKTYTPQ